MEKKAKEKMMSEGHTFTVSYRIINIIGFGSTSIVVSAQSIISKQLVNVKIINKSLLPFNSWIRNRILGIVPREIHYLFTLMHISPLIPKYIEHFESVKYFYLVIEPLNFNDVIKNDLENKLEFDLEYYFSIPAGSNAALIIEKQSSDLFNLLKETRLDLSTAKSICLKILKVLSLLHSIDIIHGDIKPENILVNNNQVQVIDFGSCLSLTGDINQMVSTEMFSGTLKYAPPDILSGAEIYSPLKTELVCFANLILYVVGDLEDQICFDLIEKLKSGNLSCKEAEAHKWWK